MKWRHSGSLRLKNNWESLFDVTDYSTRKTYTQHTRKFAQSYFDLQDNVPAHKAQVAMQTVCDLWSELNTYFYHQIWLRLIIISLLN